MNKEDNLTSGIVNFVNSPEMIGIYYIETEDYEFLFSKEIFKENDYYVSYAKVGDDILITYDPPISRSHNHIYYYKDLSHFTLYSNTKQDAEEVHIKHMIIGKDQYKYTKFIKTLKVDRCGVAKIIDYNTIQLDTEEIVDLRNNGKYIEKLISTYDMHRANNEYKFLIVTFTDPETEDKEEFYLKINKYKDYKIVDSIKFEDLEFVKEAKEATLIPYDKVFDTAFYIRDIIQENTDKKVDIDSEVAGLIYSESSNKDSRYLTMIESVLSAANN